MVTGVSTLTKAGVKAIDKSLTKGVDETLDIKVGGVAGKGEVGAIANWDNRKVPNDILGGEVNNPIINLEDAPIGEAFWGDPSKINFSQLTISENNYAELMKNGDWKWDINNPLLLIRRSNGVVVSLDNRRLTAVKKVGIKSIPLKIFDENDIILDYKTYRTAEEAFQWRANHPKTIKAGGPIGSDGVSTLPVAGPVAKKNINEAKNKK